MFLLVHRQLVEDHLAAEPHGKEMVAMLPMDLQIVEVLAQQRQAELLDAATRARQERAARAVPMLTVGRGTTLRRAVRRLAGATVAVEGSRP